MPCNAIQWIVSRKNRAAARVSPSLCIIASHITSHEQSSCTSIDEHVNNIASGDESAVGGNVIRHDALISLDYFRLFVLYSHLFPQRDRERERDGPRKSFPFSFFFLSEWVRCTPPGPRIRGGGRAKIIDGAPSMGPIPQDWGLLHWLLHSEQCHNIGK
jgi:hypothetical protein